MPVPSMGVSHSCAFWGWGRGERSLNCRGPRQGLICSLCTYHLKAGNSFQSQQAWSECVLPAMLQQSSSSTTTTRYSAAGDPHICCLHILSSRCSYADQAVNKRGRRLGFFGSTKAGCQMKEVDGEEKGGGDGGENIYIYNRG